MKKSMFEVRHPFFRPFYRRFIATFVILAWAVFEWTNNAQTWALVFSIAGLYLFVQFFLRFDPKDYEDRSGE
ncbi:MAG: hypothetical protein AAF222_13980 [Pseudomonadota bacterium]